MEESRQPVIVGGLRTPFAKRGTALAALSPLELGQQVTAELVERLELDPTTVEQVVFGQVIPSIEAPNTAREIVLGIGLPREIEAHTVSKACITSYQTTVDVYRAIADGSIDCGIAGGTESASQVPITVSEPLRDALLEAEQADGLTATAKSFRGVGPSDLAPQPPPIAEYSTGETMGEAAERMAKENGISRRDQDEFAHRSHCRAAEAWENGELDSQVMTMRPGPDYDQSFERDNLVRPDSDLDRYAALEPVFDPRHGSVTAGNSSPLTDGAAALVLMSQEKAEAEGYPVLGRIRRFAFGALDPEDQLLLGPALVIPRLLDRAGMSLDDFELVDLHEAFSAAVLSVLEALASQSFARDRLGRSSAVGEIDREHLNVQGGSIALGHPFAATGARQILQTLTELGRRGGGLALCSACAAGGMAAAMILEVDR